MNIFKKNINFAIIPIIVTVWGIFIIWFLDPFYARSSDPEYIYLVNGLNCAILKFGNIGHYDHPGTPFQIFCGIAIRITHLFSGKGNIVQDVFARPEHYLNAISSFILLVHAMLIFTIGFIGTRRKIPFWQIALLQASCLFNSVLLWLFCRVNPDRFFMLVGLIFILVYLQYGYKNHSPRKFALWSGLVMALGLSTKFNFLPILFLPLLFIDTNKNRLIYVGSGIISFFIFISPVMDRINEFRRFMMDTLTHDGLYGSGEAKVLNFDKIMESGRDIFKINPELLFLIPILIILIIIAIKNKKKELKGFIFIFTGLLFVIALQLLMVSKHFKNYYLSPLFVMYGFIFFIISVFLSKTILKKNVQIILGLILPVLFLGITLKIVHGEYTMIAKELVPREKIRLFVENEISKNDFWFVEPTWECGPYPENALVYGITFCRHHIDYQNQMMAANPNIITYEGNKEEVKLWRGTSVSLDSILSTKKNIYIYSTPDRQAHILMEMLQASATRSNMELFTDTVYSDSDTKTEIIKINGVESTINSQYTNDPASLRKKRIEEFVRAIKTSTEWLEMVKKKAIINNVPIDTMILRDAIYMTDNEKK